MIPTYAVIPTNGRPVFREAIESIVNQVDRIIIVANGEFADAHYPSYAQVVWDDGPRNISRWWNRGIEVAASQVVSPRWNVLVMNDDVIAGEYLTVRLASGMRLHDAVMSYPNLHDSYETVWREATPVDLRHRITGYCFMLAGEAELRADESLVWWYGDDDLDWQARERGGAALVTECSLTHRYPNVSTNADPELVAQTGRDRETFQRKWGTTPW